MFVPDFPASVTFYKIPSTSDRLATTFHIVWGNCGLIGSPLFVLGLAPLFLFRSFWPACAFAHFSSDLMSKTPSNNNKDDDTDPAPPNGKNVKPPKLGELIQLDLQRQTVFFHALKQYKGVNGSMTLKHLRDVNLIFFPPNSDYAEQFSSSFVCTRLI